MMPTFLYGHWTLLQKNSCYKNFILASWLKIWQFWKTSKMSHCYILQSFKRYKASLARCNHKKIHNLFFCTPYICTKTYRKFYEPLWKPIFGKQIPNFLCHTVQSLTRVSISRKSREEMTHVFLSRAGELYFHFSFSSRFSRFLDNKSLSFLDLQDF